MVYAKTLRETQTPQKVKTTEGAVSSLAWYRAGTQFSCSHSQLQHLDVSCNFTAYKSGMNLFIFLSVLMPPSWPGSYRSDNRPDTGHTPGNSVNLSQSSLFYFYLTTLLDQLHKYQTQIQWILFPQCVKLMFFKSKCEYANVSQYQIMYSFIDYANINVVWITSPTFA